MATKKYITKRLDIMATKASGSKTEIDAITQCKRWLTQLQWADMQAPVHQKIDDLLAVVKPLAERNLKNLLSEQEQQDLHENLDIIHIYVEFQDMIYKTAWKAERERKNRQKIA